MLKQLMLRQEYRSNEVVIGRDLYEKCLPWSSRFDRAVGFFAGSVFAVCPEAFHRFFQGRGRMRVICCPILDRVDIDALVSGYRDRPEILRTSGLDVLARGRREVLREKSPLTAWLVASGNLDVRIAIRDSPSTNHIYHEKLGLFGDQEGSWVAFAGSANESLAGLEGNFESVDVFRSWIPAERKRLDQKIRSFELLWANDTEGVEILTFAEAATRGLLKARPEGQPEAGSLSPEENSIANTDVGPLPDFGGEGCYSGLWKEQSRTIPFPLFPVSPFPLGTPPDFRFA